MADYPSMARPLGDWTGLSPELFLMIMEYLPAKALSNVSLSNKLLIPYAQDIMFRHDSKYGNSTAILWAAYASGYDNRQELALQVLNTSIRYRGDVNAIHHDAECYITAIHVAAEQGNLEFMECLLRHGADASARSFQPYNYRPFWRFASHRDLPLSLNCFSKKASFYRFEILPLFFPFVRENWELAQLLIKLGNTPGYVAIRRRSSFLFKDAVTVFHFISNMGTFQKYIKFLIKKYHCCLDKRLPGKKTTALMVAIRQGNEEAFTELLRGGADPNIPDGNKIYPLVEAIQSTMSSIGNNSRRAWYGRLAPILLEHGANPNPGGSESPLALALSFAKHDWIYQRASMIPTIDSLLEHGANANVVMPNGRTAAQFVLDIIVDQKGSPSLESILEKLLNHGASANERYLNGKSMLFRVLGCETKMKKLKRVTEILARHGAALQDAEADVALKYWVLHRSAWPSAITVDRYCEHFTQETIDWAFSYVLDIDIHDAMKKFNWLDEHCKASSIPSDIVARAFLKNSPKLMLGTLTALPFDVHWTDEQGRGFLHLVVKNLETHARYKEKDALWDANNLIEGGISVFQRDNSGKTALGYLLSLETAYNELEIFFHRQRAKEGGEIF